MHPLRRLLAYLRPYWPQFSASVLLMAVVGLMEGFRLLLIGPILGSVLNPAKQADTIRLFTIPGTHHVIYLQQFIPSHFHNVLTVVAVALMGSTIIKGLCDYVGTYLVNYAGLGLVTDLRNTLYKSLLYRSIGFFSRHTTGTLVSTLIIDIHRIHSPLPTHP